MKQIFSVYLSVVTLNGVDEVVVFTGMPGLKERANPLSLLQWTFL